MIKIRVNNLPETGLKLDLSISSEAINERLSTTNPPEQAAESKLSLSTDIKINLQCERASHGMTTTGGLETEVEQDCGYCGQLVKRTLKVQVSHIFKFHSDAVNLPEEDLGVTYYSGEQVDLMPVLEEIIILQLSPFWRPELKTDGKCSICDICPRQQFKPISSGTNSLALALEKAKRS